MAIQGTRPYSKSSLFGIVSSYVSYHDTAVSNQTGRPRVIFEENAGLAIVVPSDRVIEAVESADVALRARAAPAPPSQKPEELP